MSLGNEFLFLLRPEHHSPVLVSGPLELGGVGVPGAHVLGLQMLHLGEDVEPAGAVSSRSRHLGVSI